MTQVDTDSHHARVTVQTYSPSGARRNLAVERTDEQTCHVPFEPDEKGALMLRFWLRTIKCLYVY